MLRFFLSKKFTILLISVSALFFLASASLAFSRLRSERMDTLINGLNRCAQVTDNDNALIACTKVTVDQQLIRHSTKDLMYQITAGSLPEKYFDCHSIAHVIGVETYKKYGDVEEAVAQCTRGCFDGCLHGVIAGAVEKEFGAGDAGVDIAHMDVGQIERIGSKYCSNLGLCHGIGHVLYTVINDFKKASDACAAISDGLSEANCTAGVFMQGVGDISDALVLATSSLSIMKAPAGNYAYPCDTMPLKYRFSCFQFLWPYQRVTFSEAGITDVAKQRSLQIKTCEGFDGLSRSYCFDGIGRYVVSYATAVRAPDIDTYAADFCTGMPSDSDRKSCILGNLRVLYGYHSFILANRLCPILASGGLGDFCFFANFEYMDLPDITNSDIACEYSDDKPSCSKAYDTFAKVRGTLPDYRYGLYGK